MRTNSPSPSPIEARSPSRRGRKLTCSAWAARAIGATSAAPIDSSARAVPSPEPATPSPTTYRKKALSSVFSTAPTRATMNGVRVSSSPRSVPVAASTTSIPGSPGSTMRRYATALVATDALAPIAATIWGANTIATPATATPIRAASQIPSSPAFNPSRRRPAPKCRAVVAVVA